MIRRSLSEMLEITEIAKVTCHYTIMKPGEVVSGWC